MPKTPDIPVAFTAASISNHIPSEGLRAVQSASVKPLGTIYYMLDDLMWDKHTGVFGAKSSIWNKTVIGWQKCMEHPGVADRGLIIIMHHDTVIEDPAAFWELCQFVLDEDLAAAGPRDGGTVIRKNLNGDLYINSSFLVANPRKLGKWWERLESDEFDGYYSFEDYWGIVHRCLGNLFYLDTAWRDPPIGRTTTYFFRRRPVASHLWYSMGEARSSDRRHTIEGLTPEEICSWRREFIEVYAERFGVDVSDLLRRMDGARRPEDWAEVIDSSVGGGALQRASQGTPVM